MRDQHLLTLEHLTASDLGDLVTKARDLKERRQVELVDPVLEGKVCGLLFEAPSLRSRLAFEAGIAEFGGSAVQLSPVEIGLGKRESFQDIARVLSSMVHTVAYRTTRHERLLRLSEYCDVPLYNAGSDVSAPVQGLADALTLQEALGSVEGLTVAVLGPAGPSCNNWIQLAGILGAEVRICCPPGHEPDRSLLKQALDRKAKIRLSRKPDEALAGADVICLQPWPDSLDKETGAPYRITSGLLERAPEAVLLHPMPIGYKREMSPEATKHPNALWYKQAENHLHVAKALLSLTL